MRQHWEVDGWTAEAIAAELGTTKSAILGKANRRRLEQCRDPAKLNSLQRANQKAVRASDGVQTVIERLAALDTFPGASACRYPIGYPGRAGFRFCGDRVANAAKAYCPEHERLCVVRVGALSLS